MADRVHPCGDASQTAPLHASNNPQPGTYVVQIPKDQIYRVPPPENATLYDKYTRQKPRHNCCRSCLCWLLFTVASLLLLSAIAAVVFYLVVRPESPNYSVQKISFKGFNLTAASSPSSTVPQQVDVAVRAENPNRKMGIYYERDSSANVVYTDIKLCDGALPAFYQPPKNVTELETALTGTGIRLTSAAREGLVEAQRQGMVALKLHVRAPARIKVGSIKSWKITVKVDCGITVNKLAPEAKIVSKDCNYGVDLW
ncbi:NDR1/HIN1-like protein 13 [Argentina anserina]|uniref:NDR1/HIN1-like protein 13 n=1 Tax=Argentina anserina TaxID=57926 RepID=UPI00217679B0|nr:NDR1/HIN1-like protein 13 [Potentilla anserina]